MPRFREKSIEAVRFDGMNERGHPEFAGSAMPDWLFDALAKEPTEPGSIVRRGDAIGIFTLEGEHRADPGDWLICNAVGHIWACEQQLFDAIYEPV
jgi:hypothetical protein